MSIAFPSDVTRVVVHARGALVTREVTLPEDLPEGTVDVVLPGITSMASPGSARASLEEGARTVSAVHMALVIPKGGNSPSRTTARVRELTARIDRVTEEHRVLSARRQHLVALTLSPRLRAFDARPAEREPFDRRFGEALRMAALIDEKLARIDEVVLRVEKERRDLSRALEVARLEDAQASTSERDGAARLSQSMTVRVVGQGRPGKLVATYAVLAARWWPAYVLRVERDVPGGAVRARWTFEALVAQKTGEDWSGVTMSLSSAELWFDARLPELASLRLGRARPPARRPFRPPPEGVDEMFAGYLAFGASRSAPPTQPRMSLESSGSRKELTGRGEELSDALDEADTIVRDFPFPPDALARDSSLPTLAMAMAPTASLSVPAPASPPPAPPPVPGRAPQARTLGFRGGPPGAAGAAREGEEKNRRVAPFSEKEMETVPRPLMEMDFSSEEQLLAPSETWSNYDTLVLAGPDHPRRGRLVPSAELGDVDAATRACHEIDRAVDDRHRDPSTARGTFDHRYEALGKGDIPSDGRAHRVAVMAAECAVRLAWRAVPSEAAEVYREAHVANPFDAPLLGGPVDVYLDGTFLSTTCVDRIDRGGTLVCGMGVDDRIKVARNVRVEEEAAGLLGGSTSVMHAIDIELSSAIDASVNVSVIERVPVTDDKALEVKTVRAEPLPVSYDQADRGAPVRGGMRFDIVVAPKEKASVTLVYRLVFPQKLDVVGGSRRG